MPTLTMDTVVHAAKLGHKYLQPFTVEKLAQVLDCPLITMLECIDTNHEHFSFGVEGNITFHSNTSGSKALSATTMELWDWFCANAAGGNKDSVLPVTTAGEIATKVQFPIKWAESAGELLLPYMSASAQGEEVYSTCEQKYGKDISSLLAHMGTVDPQGQGVTKYIFAIPVNQRTIQVFGEHGYHVFTVDIAQKAMAASEESGGWTDIEYGVPETVSGDVSLISALEKSMTKVIESVRYSEQVKVTVDSAQPAQPAQPTQPVQEQPAQPAAQNNPSDGVDKKRTVKRRTKEELTIEREGWANHCQINGAPADIVDSVGPQGVKKYTEAEKIYKDFLNTLETVKPLPTPEQENAPESNSTSTEPTAQPAQEQPPAQPAQPAQEQPPAASGLLNGLLGGNEPTAQPAQPAQEQPPAQPAQPQTMNTEQIKQSIQERVIQENPQLTQAKPQQVQVPESPQEAVMPFSPDSVGSDLSQPQQTPPPQPAAQNSSQASTLLNQLLGG